MRFSHIGAALVLTGALASAALAHDMKAASASGMPGPAWSMNATAIEACSCPVFCQCYFNTAPAGHGGHEGHEGHGEGGEHFCRFNNAYKVNRGMYGATKLDGAKFWIYGDLGGDFTKGMDWAVVTFDKGTTPAQREAIGAIASHLFPVHWNSLTTAEGDISWNSDKETATALLDGGKSAEVRLNKFKGMNGGAVTISNLPYWGATSNTGFVIMPNSIEALRIGDKPYEFHGTNGFMITVDIDSKMSSAHGM